MSGQHSEELPRLLYFGYVDVAATAAGSIVLHRLLQDYPPENLFLVSPQAEKPNGLAASHLKSFPGYPLKRLFRTRLNNLWYSSIVLRQELRRRLVGGVPRWLRKELDKFKPEAVLTMALAGGWMQGQGIARHYGIPLHLMVHDDNCYGHFWIPPLRNWGERRFAACYREAATRFCVSGAMEADYRKRFGVAGTVLLPARGADSLCFTAPRAGVADEKRHLNVVYAGSIYGKTFGELAKIGNCLAAKGHRLTVFTPSHPLPPMEQNAVDWRAAIPSPELVRYAHEEADIMLLYTDFTARARAVVRTLFPSKMVDYTAAAVPLLVVAPEDASITGYVKSRSYVAELVTSSDPAQIAEAADRLAAHPERRAQLAAGAVKVARQDFAPEKAVSAFYDALRVADRP